MQPVGEQRNQAGTAVAADHVEFVGPEHRGVERMGQEQRAARLDEHPHSLGPRLAPAVGSDQHGVARRRVEEAVPRRLVADAAESRAGAGRHVAGDDDPVSMGPGGCQDGCDGAIDSEDAEFHALIVSAGAGSGQPRPVRPRFTGRAAGWYR
ncbi:MAG: hypothetical protein ACK56I_30575, partial [bacterium]